MLCGGMSAVRGAHHHCVCMRECCRDLLCNLPKPMVPGAAATASVGGWSCVLAQVSACGCVGGVLCCAVLGPAVCLHSWLPAVSALWSVGQPDAAQTECHVVS
jgi:hypothetical protein